MKRELPSLVALKTFECAGRHECFTKAAEELAVTQSAVSRQIRNLEDSLGVKMFVRKGRTVHLTQEGRSLHSVVVDAFDRLIDGTVLTRRNKKNSVLRVSVESILAVRWFVPRLISLMSEHPEIEVSLKTHHGKLEDEEVDVAILWGDNVPAGMNVERLYDEEVFPVCSPALPVEGTPLNVAQGIESVRLLHGPGTEDWRDWLQVSGVNGIDIASGLHFSGQETLLEAATSGLGVALGRSLLVCDDLSSRRLIEPFETRLPSQHSYWLGTFADRPPHVHLTFFKQWLMAQLAKGIHVVEGKSATVEDRGGQARTMITGSAADPEVD